MFLRYTEIEDPFEDPVTVMFGLLDFLGSKMAEFY